MKRKTKFKKRGIILIIIILSLISYLLIYQGITLFNTYNIETKLKKLNYSSESIELIKENKLDNFLIDNNVYSKTLEVALIEGNYIKKNLDTYLSFEYKDEEKYIKHLNELITLGYKKDEINIIFQNLKTKEIDMVVNKEEKISNLTNYILDDYFKINNLDRYIAYKKNNNYYSYEKVINYVNMNLDYNYYEKIISIKNPDNILVLVNKYHKLEKNYIPKNLVSFTSSYATSKDIKTIPIVKENFEEMASDMKSIGLKLVALSVYRSYDNQLYLYNKYVQRDGIKAANTYSAKPGHSEHQTGLAVDVYNGVSSFNSFTNTNEYAWLKNNAHKYGFIIRYPKGKENITGYQYEPWHLRYVGIEPATYIYINNITFDEYYAKFLDN